MDFVRANSKKLPSKIREYNGKVVVVFLHGGHCLDILESIPEAVALLMCMGNGHGRTIASPFNCKKRRKKGKKIRITSPSKCA